MIKSHICISPGLCFIIPSPLERGIYLGFGLGLFDLGLFDLGLFGLGLSGLDLFTQIVNWLIWVIAFLCISCTLMLYKIRKRVQYDTYWARCVVKDLIRDFSQPHLFQSHGCNSINMLHIDMRTVQYKEGHVPTCLESFLGSFSGTLR